MPCGVLRRSHGKNSGSVELQFELNGKSVAIHRMLKRKASISQEAGKLIVDEDPNMAVQFYDKALKVVGVSKKLKMGLLGDIAYAYESLGETEKADNYIEAAKLSMHSGRSD